MKKPKTLHIDLFEEEDGTGNATQQKIDKCTNPIFAQTKNPFIVEINKSKKMSSPIHFQKTVNEKEARKFYNRQVEYLNKVVQKSERLQSQYIVEKCTFHPVLNLKSVELAASRMDKETNYQVEQMFGGNKLHITKGQLENFLFRNKAHIARKQQYILEQNDKKKLQQNETCTFHPKILNRKKISHERKTDDLFVDLYEMGLQHKKKKEKHAENFLQKKMKEQLQECTFKPSIQPNEYYKKRAIIKGKHTKKNKNAITYTELHRKRNPRQLQEHVEEKENDSPPTTTTKSTLYNEILERIDNLNILLHENKRF